MGTRTLSGAKITVKLTGTFQNTLDDGTVVAISHPDLNYVKSLSDGSGPNEANRAWQISGSLEINEQIILDLEKMAGLDIGAGEGMDGLGQEYDIECITMIAIVNDNLVTDPGLLSYADGTVLDYPWDGLGGTPGSSNAYLKGQGLALKCQMAEGGINVGETNGYRLRLSAILGPVDYKVFILGRTDENVSSSSASSSSSVSSSSSSSSSVSTSSSSRSETSSSSVSSVSSSSSSESSPSSVSSSSSSESSSSLSTSDR